ncbi:hypothetical protein LCGC14_2989860, partial [marine sediment metagenome]
PTSIVADRDTGLKYFRNKNGEYKPLDDGNGRASTDFTKAIDAARKNLVRNIVDKNPLEDFSPSDLETLEAKLTSDDILREAQRVIEEQNEAVALAETLQELIEGNEGGFTQLSGLEDSQVAPGTGVISSAGGQSGPPAFSRPSTQSVEFSRSVAQKEDPLAPPSKTSDKDEKDTVIDFNTMKASEVIKKFQGMNLQERQEFVSQLSDDEFTDFVDQLPKTQRSAVRRAVKRLEEEHSRPRPSKTRIRAAKKKLARVLFEFGEQSKRKPIRTPSLGGF